MIQEGDEHRRQISGAPLASMMCIENPERNHTCSTSRRGKTTEFYDSYNPYNLVIIILVHASYSSLASFPGPFACREEGLVSTACAYAKYIVL